MRIAIDTTPLINSHGGRGTGTYTRELLEALKADSHGNTYLPFRQGEPIPDGSDVVHYPYFDPFFLTLPAFRSTPTVVTVHDLIPIRFAEHFPRGLRGEIKWFLQKRSLRGCQRIITDSEASRRDISRFAQVSRDNIDVIYLAPSQTFRPVRDRAALRRVKEKFALPQHFLLYVGDVNWNKNVQGLIRAFAVTKKDVLREDLSLMLVGQAHRNTALSETNDVRGIVQDLELSPYVQTPGYVSDEELAALYTLADACIQPSFAEGFGLPVLEAMACGCPVVASQDTSLVEIAGPALLVNPYDIRDIARGMTGALRSDRRVLSPALIAWAGRFTWKATARRTVSCYEKVLERH